ncbi:cytochrome c oxidase assembly protein CtaG/Cox11-domain-containing protein [Entophlyctis helioformis]|nr:cytochrome c oxidase assembly protein CtaG/Cox11-domain-containing protein [Entophlyctis helioformis]
MAAASAARTHTARRLPTSSPSAPSLLARRCRQLWTSTRPGMGGQRTHMSTAALPSEPRLSPTERLILDRKVGIRSTIYYTASVFVTFVGLAYAAVPIYKMLCTDTGFDGTPLTSLGHKFEPESMVPVTAARPIKILFDSSLADTMYWKFTPETRQISIVPGETALAFFHAVNPTDEDITGISTYSVTPAKAAQYFNKIQCFCFEEQKLAAGEEVDMPVFFYIDPEFATDPWMADVRSITLHYTFFKSKLQ